MTARNIPEERVIDRIARIQERERELGYTARKRGELERLAPLAEAAVQDFAEAGARPEDGLRALVLAARQALARHVGEVETAALFSAQAYQAARQVSGPRSGRRRQAEVLFATGAA